MKHFMIAIILIGLACTACAADKAAKKAAPAKKALTMEQENASLRYQLALQKLVNTDVFKEFKRAEAAWNAVKPKGKKK